VVYPNEEGRAIPTLPSMWSLQPARYARYWFYIRSAWSGVNSV